MRATPVRLADTALGAPYFANSVVIREPGGRHQRQDYLDLLTVTAGEGRHITYGPSGEARPQRLAPGRMALYRPRDVVRFAGSGGQGMTILFVSFPLADWQAFGGVVGIDPSWMSADEPPIVDFDPEDADVVRPFHRALERFRDRPTFLDLARFWVDVIPVLLPAHGRGARGLGAPEWLLSSVDALRRNDAELRGGLARLRALAHVSPAHLAATVRRYYGCTPTALVTELRLQRAAVLLSSSTESVGAIAVRCGFADLAHFSNRFRAAFHVSPREYRSRSLLVARGSG